MSFGVPPVPTTPARAQADASAQLGADREALSHATADRPAAFSVSGRLIGDRHSRGSWGRGELLISPGTVVFVPSGLTRRLKGMGEFSHGAPAVRLVTVRSGLPWPRRFLVLENGGSFLRVRVPAARYRRMRHALDDSGLTVHAETSRRAP